MQNALIINTTNSKKFKWEFENGPDVRNLAEPCRVGYGSIFQDVKPCRRMAPVSAIQSHDGFQWPFELRAITKWGAKLEDLLYAYEIRSALRSTVHANYHNKGEKR